VTIQCNLLPQRFEIAQANDIVIFYAPYYRVVADLRACGMR